MNRRTFLKGAAALMLPAFVPSRALGRAGKSPAGERITLGFIGVGGMGSANLSGFLNHPEVEVLAVCDVDAARLSAAKERVGNGCAAYNDYRELLDRGDIDAVVVCTPDHWHTLISIHACQAGKDIYCEKPLTLTVEEAGALTRAVRRQGRVFQTGSQQRSSWEFHRACTLVRNGCIGRVQKVLVGLPEGNDGEFAPDEEPPPGLDWDLWLGPAPAVPYNRLRHPYNFRWFFDYSGGKMTDWGAHHLDIAQWGLDMDGSGPVTVEGEAVFPTRGIYETAMRFEVRYGYATGQEVICSSHGRGAKFVGEDGWVHVDRGFLETEPASLAKVPLSTMKRRLFKSPGHHQNWIDCIRTRERPICDVEVSAGSAVVCHVGNIALRTGKRLDFDPKNRVFLNDPQANRWLGKPYRAPWHL